MQKVSLAFGHLQKVLGKMPPGKLPPGNLSPGKLPQGKLPPRKLPQENCQSENCPLWNSFVNFFLSLVFIFMRIFVYKKNLFSCFFYYKFVYSICLHYFFLSVCFWFSGMTYNVYHTYMRDQQCWTSLPGYTLFLQATLFSTRP